jgi:hypothetical protein
METASNSADKEKFPDWLRWTALAWLVVWSIAYWRTWGVANFAHLCDVAVILTCVGFWTNSSLLLSSQAVSSLLIDVAWSLDAACKYFFGCHIFGGTDYLFDPRYPLWVRLLSLFHVILPMLLLWALHRGGYDRRAWALQSIIALFAFAAARLAPPNTNINFVFSDPFFHHTWIAPVQIVLSTLFLGIVVYLPTHLILRRIFPPSRST